MFFISDNTKAEKTNDSRATVVNKESKNLMARGSLDNPKAIEENMKREYLLDNPNYKGKIKIVDMNTYEKIMSGEIDNSNAKEFSVSEWLKEAKEATTPNISSRNFAIYPGSSRVNPYDKVPLLLLNYNGSNGNVVASTNASAFKVNQYKLGIAGHVVYNKANGLGWPSNGYVYFGMTSGLTGASGIAMATQFTTNEAWKSASSEEAGRFADFGSIKIDGGMGVPSSNLPVQISANSDSNVKAVGFPKGNGWSGFDMGISSGGTVYTGSNSNWLNSIYTSTNTKIMNGMSGGPLLSSNNNVIGINVASNSNTSLFVKIDSIVYNHIVK